MQKQTAARRAENAGLLLRPPRPGQHTSPCALRGRPLLPEPLPHKLGSQPPPHFAWSCVYGTDPRWTRSPQHWTWRRPPPGGTEPAQRQLVEQRMGWVTHEGKGANLGLSLCGVCMLHTRVSVGHSAQRERHPSKNTLAHPPATGLATHTTQCAASGPHPHLHVPRGPRSCLPYGSSLPSPQDGPTSQGAARTWAWPLAVS